MDTGHTRFFEYRIVRPSHGRNWFPGKEMTKYIFAFLLTARTLLIFGQNKETKKTRDKDFGLSIGYVHQGDNFITFGGLVGKNVGNIHTPGWSYGLATEVDLNKGNSIVGVKTFFDINLIMFGARLNAINYFKGHQTDFRLTPEVGLTLNSLFTIYYGYNIPIRGTALNEISRSRLNVTINLFRKLKVNGG
jgi:hypothetical protein